jgi:hypothetical protein
MKKVNVASQQEILASHVNTMADYLEQALSLMSANVLKITAGVVAGLTATYTSGAVSPSVSIASGSIFTSSGVYGELESASGINVTLPVSGTRVDTLVAYYQEVYDSPSSGNILMDVTTRVESVGTVFNRRFGSIQIALIQNTPASSITSGIVLHEVTSSSTGIVAVVDKRVFTNTTLFGFTLFPSLAALKTAAVANQIVAIWGTDEYGIYIGNTTSSESYDDELIVAPNSGTGRWYKAAATINDIFAYTDPAISDLQDGQDSISGSIGTLNKTLYGSYAIDFASIAANTVSTTGVIVSGAAIGDEVTVIEPDTLNNSLWVTGKVTAANTVTMKILNPTAGAIDPPSLTYKIIVRKH